MALGPVNERPGLARSVSSVNGCDMAVFERVPFMAYFINATSK